MPTPKASAAARDLLMKFARTNTPASLALALPSYAEDPDAVAASNKYEVQDSWIAQEALRLRRAKCCWEILKEGFILREGVKTTASPRKTRGRRASHTIEDEGHSWGGQDNDAPEPVSEQAWGVLDWMLTLFERDEAIAEKSDQVRYSPLLLKQIPTSRSERGALWDVDVPLDVAFHAMQQSGESRRSLGVRILTLLVNLGSTTLLDFPMFLNAVSTRVSQLSLEDLTYLLSALPVTEAMAQFKVHLCRHTLGGRSTTLRRPKPAARPRAQPRRRPCGEVADVSASQDALSSQDVSMATTQSPPSMANAPSMRRKYPTISTADLLELLARPCSDMAFTSQTLCLKGELVLNYGWLQQQLGQGERDEKWSDLLGDGSVQKAVEDAFDPRVVKKVTDVEARSYVEKRRVVLLAIVSMWRP
ncbi:hypothetical protein BN946_scf184775.g27 [Trametes cinnabarina]|uniref:Uncharacterized protein n=1 Tax=Pycnoporus cinnabarinus TaxID=5643 RepID=A0A060ST95_PYCCI|nr:hypothetical protein BN946_scf184775.g27 [Trametes cinnabarina]